MLLMIVLSESVKIPRYYIANRWVGLRNGTTDRHMINGNEYPQAGTAGRIV